MYNNRCAPSISGVHVCSAVQDFLTSAFLLTAKDRFYSRSDFGQLCAHMNDALQHVDLPIPTILKPMELWTGKQVFSVLVRPNANTRYVCLVAGAFFCRCCDNVLSLSEHHDCFPPSSERGFSAFLLSWIAQDLFDWLAHKLLLRRPKTTGMLVNSSMFLCQPHRGCPFRPCQTVTK